MFFRCSDYDLIIQGTAAALQRCNRLQGVIAQIAVFTDREGQIKELGRIIEIRQQGALFFVEAVLKGIVIRTVTKKLSGWMM